MGKRKRIFKRGQILELKIETMAFGGKGIARVPVGNELFTVFVQNTIPGQTVKALVVKSKPRHAECKLMEVLEHSPDETEIPYQEIPGAPYARLSIQKQQEYKHNTAIELFKRIGKIENAEELIDEYIASPNDWHYRNKMEYSFSEIRYDFDKKDMVDDFGFGFKHRGTWWSVENLDADSGLFDKEVEDNLHKVRTFLQNSGFPAWHPPQKKGFFRHFVVRKSFLTNKILIGFVTSGEGVEDFGFDAFVKFLRQLWGDRIAGIIHVLNKSVGDYVNATEGNTEMLYGETKLVEELLGLKFEISLQSFFQPNPKCAEKLYSKAIDYLKETEREDGFIMDLFCGTGTISQLVAKYSGKRVVGVDIVEEAIEDAKENAKRNGIENISFHAADVGKFLKEFPEYQGKLSTIIMDPPRAGIAPKTLLKVIDLNAPAIVYISCNPATQARDAETLREAGYELKKISLIDQFPHTAHLESIMHFEK